MKNKIIIIFIIKSITITQLQNVAIHAFWERVSEQHHINECQSSEQHAPVLRHTVTLFKNEYHDKVE